MIFLFALTPGMIISITKGQFMDFDLTEQDWIRAEENLRGQPNGTKLDKYPTNPKDNTKVKWILFSKCSFIIIDEVIYAISKQKKAHEQTLIKKGLTRDGYIFDILIKDASSQQQVYKNEQTKTYEGVFPQAIRIQPGMKITLPEPYGTLQTNQKIYTVMKSNALCLSHFLNDNRRLSNTQKKILSLRICLFIKDWHKITLVPHKNIQAKHFDVKINGNYIVAIPITPFVAEQNNVIANKKYYTRVPGFISNEIFYNESYTLSSDYFSLAIMLLFQCDVTGNNIHELYFNRYIESAWHHCTKRLWLNPIEWLIHENVPIEPELKSILFGMLNIQPFLRNSVNHIIKYLCNELITKHKLEPDLKEEFENYLEDLQPPRTLIFSPFQISDVCTKTTKAQTAELSTCAKEKKWNFSTRTFG